MAKLRAVGRSLPKVVTAPRSLPPPDAPRISHVDLITPRWFAAYGTSIETGRDFDDRDVEDARRVMIQPRCCARARRAKRHVVYRFDINCRQVRIRTSEPRHGIANSVQRDLWSAPSLASQISFCAKVREAAAS